MDEVVYQRTKEQRDHFRDMAEMYKGRAEALENLVMRIDRRMGHGWTEKLAEALTPGDAVVKQGKQ